MRSPKSDRPSTDILSLATVRSGQAPSSMAQSDEFGILRFEGPEQNYHLQLLKAPEGYHFDAGFEMYTGSTYSEWMLYLWKE